MYHVGGSADQLRETLQANGQSEAEDERTEKPRRGGGSGTNGLATCTVLADRVDRIMPLKGARVDSPPSSESLDK